MKQEKIKRVLVCGDMGYLYKEERAELFTEEGQKLFIKIRDAAQDLLSKAGSFRMSEVIQGNIGSSWQMLACVDRLVELGEIYECTNPMSNLAQHRIFTRSKRMMRYE